MTGHLQAQVDFRFSEVGVYSKLMKDARVDEHLGQSQARLSRRAGISGSGRA